MLLTKFCHDPSLCPNFKNKNPPLPPLNFRGEETMLRGDEIRNFAPGMFLL